MKKLIAVVLFILLAVITGEVVFLALPAGNRSPLAYTNEEMRSSTDGYFAEVMSKAKEKGVSVNTLAAHMSGAVMAKKSMVQNYKITVTAKGEVQKIEDTGGRKYIRLQDAGDPNETIAFSFRPENYTEIRMVPPTLNFADIREGDMLTITDTVDMKNPKNSQAIIER